MGDHWSILLDHDIFLGDGCGGWEYYSRYCYSFFVCCFFFFCWWGSGGGCILESYYCNYYYFYYYYSRGFQYPRWIMELWWI